jgi:hypothetical protein
MRLHASGSMPERSIIPAFPSTSVNGVPLWVLPENPTRDEIYAVAGSKAPGVICLLRGRGNKPLPASLPPESVLLVLRVEDLGHAVADADRRQHRLEQAYGNLAGRENGIRVGFTPSLGQLAELRLLAACAESVKSLTGWLDGSADTDPRWQLES